MLIEMNLVGLAIDPFNNSPIVILKDRASVEREMEEEDTETQTGSSLEGESVALAGRIPVLDEKATEEEELVINEHILPIWIGEAEAHAIASVLLNLASPRPTTHDLLKKLISLMKATLSRVVVTDVRDNTFYAKIELLQEDGQVAVLDARPSDAIALALRCDADVFVDSKVLEKTKKGENVPEMNESHAEDFEEQRWKELFDHLSINSTKKYTQ